MANLTEDQHVKFKNYQIKALRLISSLLPYAKSHMPYAILELGSADDKIKRKP